MAGKLACELPESLSVPSFCGRVGVTAAHTLQLAFVWIPEIHTQVCRPEGRTFYPVAPELTLGSY